MTRWRPDPSFTDTLRRAVDADGRTIAALAKALADENVSVSGTTLGNWYTGRGMPGRRSTIESLLALERVLGLERGSLTAAVGNSLPVGDESGMVPRPGLIDEACRAWGLPVDDGLARELVHARMAISPAGLRSHSYRMTVRAERNGADRFLSGVFIPGGVDLAVPQIIPTAACSLGRTLTDDETRMQLAEVMLPRPLALHEAVTVEWEVPAVPGDEGDDFEIRVHRPTGILVAEVIFPDARPRRVVSQGGRRLRTGGFREFEDEARWVHGTVARTIVANLDDGYARLTW